MVHLFVRPKRKTFGCSRSSDSDDSSSADDETSSVATTSTSPDDTDCSSLDDDLGGEEHFKPRARIESSAHLPPPGGGRVNRSTATAVAATNSSLPDLVGFVEAAVGHLDETTKLAPIAAFVGTLKPFQALGVEWIVQRLRQNMGAILADEMGVGKTVQAIATMLRLRQEGVLVTPFLVISPLSVVHSWEREFQAFTEKGAFRVVRYAGPREARDEIIARTEKSILKSADDKSPPYRNVPFDILISTPENLLSDMFFFSKINFSLLVFDEAHRLKNDASKLYEALQIHLAHVTSRLLMTGTPVHNHPQELWALLRCANPLAFGRLKIEVDEAKSSDIKALQHLSRLLLLRRMKKDVLQDLPPIKEVVVHLPMSPLQRKLYRGILRKDITTLVSPGSQRSSLLNTVMQLRKCCNHPYMFSGVEKEPFVMGDHIVANASKLVFLDKLLARLSPAGETDSKKKKNKHEEYRHRVLVFSQFSSMLDILQDYLSYRNYACARLDGSVRGEDRSDVVDSFQKREDAFVFLLSTRAGGVGLTLTAADTVVFYDSDWNPQMDLQAQQRAHRIGQEREVTVYRLLCERTVEDGIMLNATRKLAMSEGLLRTATSAGQGKKAVEGGAGDLKALVRWAASGDLADVTDKDDEDWTSYWHGLDLDALLAAKNTVTNAAEVQECIKQGDEAIKKLQHDVIFDAPPQRRRRQADDGDEEVTAPSSVDFGAELPVMVESREKLSESQRIAKLSRTMWRRQGYASHSIPLDHAFYSGTSEGDEQLPCVQLLHSTALEARRARAGSDSHGDLPTSGAKTTVEEEDRDGYKNSDVPVGDALEMTHRIVHLVGDVTKPHEGFAIPQSTKRTRKGEQDVSSLRHGDVCIIAVPVNNSGEWSARGGLFNAVATAVKGDVAALYAAAKANSDLRLGDAHVFPARQSATLVVLFVVQRSSSQSRGSGGILDQKALGLSLERIALYAGQLEGKVGKEGMRVTLHFPHLPTSSAAEAYSTDKIFANRLAAFDTYVYYHGRSGHHTGGVKQSPALLPDSKKNLRSDEAEQGGGDMAAPRRLVLDGPFSIDESSTVCLVGFDDARDGAAARSLAKRVLLAGGLLWSSEDLCATLPSAAVLVFPDAVDPMTLPQWVWDLHGSGIPLLAASAVQ